MNKMFPGYYLPTTGDSDALWDGAIFVFDTSVLLNLYSYPEQAREEFLTVLTEIAPRTWLPYQVMLEFHRNRYSRINGSNRALFDLRDSIKKMSESVRLGFKNIQFEKRNTGIEDVDRNLIELDKVCKLLRESLEEACSNLPKAGLEDKIAQQLADIYKDKIGAPPNSQDDLDELTKDGPVRFENKIPPGYADAKDKNAIHFYGGLQYHAKFDDLVVWRQLINHARDNNIRSLIFVTAERKSDWWQKSEVDRNEILGPLPELVEEFLRETKAELFWMYSVEQFLEKAKIRSDKAVSVETIDQVRAISVEHEDNNSGLEVLSRAPFDDYTGSWRSNYNVIPVGKKRLKNIMDQLVDFVCATDAVLHTRQLDDAIIAKTPTDTDYYKIIIDDFQFPELIFELIESTHEAIVYNNVIILLIVPHNVWMDFHGMFNLKNHLFQSLKKMAIKTMHIFVETSFHLMKVDEISVL